MPTGSLLRRSIKGCALLVTLGVAGVAISVACIWVEHRTSVSLPTPTGPFAVGRDIEDWVDSDAVDPLAPTPGTKRELLVWMWYPASVGPSSAVDDYLPVRLRPRSDAADRPNIWTLLTREVTKVRGHSLRDATLAPRQAPYPVVMLRAGASAPVVSYSSLAEDLASHGYVVVGFDAPYRTSRVVFPDGRVMDRTEQNNPERCVQPDRAQMERCVSGVMAAWIGDMAFVLDRLARINASDSSDKFSGRLDMARVGVVGHSLGGAVAVQFCHDDVRCTAGIDIDGAPHGRVIETGLRLPFMFLLSDHGKESGPESAQIVGDIASIYDRIPADRRLRVMIRGAFHFTFSDDGALLKSSAVRAVLRALGMLRISGRRQLVVTAYCVRSFFDTYLATTGDTRPCVASPQYPELRVLE